jgi:acylphosphatase
MPTIRLRITGRVQGVGYRVWAMRMAASLGLDGWVRNRRDGTVELLATGAEPTIAAMVEACRKGPAAAEVAAVETCDAEPDGSRGFTSRPTE